MPILHLLFELSAEGLRLRAGFIFKNTEAYNKMVSMVDRFCGYLERAERIPLTLRVYRSDLEGLAKWFEEQTGGPFSPAKITPTDLRDYKRWLTGQDLKPATSGYAQQKLSTLVPIRPDDMCRCLLTGNLKHFPPAWLAREPRNTLQLSSMSAICGTSPDKLVSNDTVEAGAVKRKASVRTHSDAYDFERALKKLVRPFERAVVKDGSRFRPTEP